MTAVHFSVFFFSLILYFQIVERFHSLVKAEKVTDYNMVRLICYIESLSSIMKFDYLRR